MLNEIALIGPNVLTQINLIMLDPDFRAILTDKELSDIETALENEDMDYLATLAGNIVFDGRSLSEYVSDHNDNVLLWEDECDMSGVCDF
jgi:hypothetical protein